MFFDLGSDPGERYNLFNTKLDMGWMFEVAFNARRRVPPQHRRVPEHTTGPGIQRPPAIGLVTERQLTGTASR